MEKGAYHGKKKEGPKGTQELQLEEGCRVFS